MDAWQTYPLEFKGGLVSNLSPLQHGMQMPGSARILTNFEPSVEGGYKRILGYTKFDNNYVPYNGKPVVQGAGQTGTTLVVANITAAPTAGDTLTIGANTYTIATGGVSYSSSTKTVTLTLTSSLVSSPADQAAVLFSNKTNILSTGVAAWDGAAIVARGTNLYKTTGGGVTLINVPAYGTVLVKGGSQTGTSLLVDGLTGTPKVGDTFTISGVSKLYIITSTVTVTAGEATLTISPALDSSPADNAVLTFRNTTYTAGSKTRFTKYTLGSANKICGVNASDYPFSYDNSTFKRLDGNVDVSAAEHVCFFKNALFFGKEDQLLFTAPYTDDDFNVANGAGVINVGGKITALKVFREQLIIFCEQSIKRLVGNTLADFALQPITTNIGCVAGDSVQEIGGDLVFLGPDGIRSLAATDRIGDFELSSISKVVQKEFTDFIRAYSSFASLVIKGKSQYRIFGYSSAVTTASSKGILGTQFLETGMAWADLLGFKIYSCDSDFYNQSELIVFVNDNGFVYRMESGYNLDGENITSTFATPFIPINDPRIRKTFYKLNLYFEPEGTIEITLNLKLDLDDTGSIQPESITVSNVTSSTANFYGTAGTTFGTSRFGARLKKVFETQLVGSGTTFSLQFTDSSTNPSFSFDAATVEFATHDRR